MWFVVWVFEMVGLMRYCLLHVWHVHIASITYARVRKGQRRVLSPTHMPAHPSVLARMNALTDAPPLLTLSSPHPTTAHTHTYTRAHPHAPAVS